MSDVSHTVGSIRVTDKGGRNITIEITHATGSDNDGAPGWMMIEHADRFDLVEALLLAQGVETSMVKAIMSIIDPARWQPR